MLVLGIPLPVTGLWDTVVAKPTRTGIYHLWRIHRRSGDSHRLPNAEKWYAVYLFL